MELAISALIGSASSHAFDHVLTPLYLKGDDLLGISLTNNDNDIGVNSDEFTDLSTDPLVGYLNNSVFKKIVKEGATEIEVEEVQIEKSKKNKKSNKSSDELLILDLLSKISVALFILYTSYKVIVFIENTDLKWNIDHIFDEI